VSLTVTDVRQVPSRKPGWRTSVSLTVTDVRQVPSRKPGWRASVSLTVTDVRQGQGRDGFTPMGHARRPTCR
jgi:hypothetical protein